MNVAKEYTIGGNTVYINKDSKAIIIDENGDSSSDSVYLSFEDLECLIEVYSSIKGKE